MPVPGGLAPAAWHLFALFAAAIVSVVIGAFPILTASVLALAAAVLTGTVAPERAYSGFANGTILLIVVAFLVARAVVKCGLGERLGHLVVSVFGRSTLGLGYSIFLVDAVIAPAFPSNTARSGVALPAGALGGRGGGRAAGARRARAARALPDVLRHREPDRVVGAVVHGDGREPARGRDRAQLRRRDRLRLVARRLVVPTLVAMGLLPLVLYKVIGAGGDGDARGPARGAAARSRRSGRCAGTRRSWRRPSS